ncbi:MAG: esterase-like activity of phytase family protein, partial [Rhodobacterales bacterium]|nr:esterase-like activity of phytase family protein [Rhodobacterales bacterium]
ALLLPAAPAAGADPLPLTSKPLALFPVAPAQTRLDRLDYRGGLVLTSSDARFGGLSALWVDDRGEAFTALSDRGYRIDGRFVTGADGHLAGVADAHIADLTDLAGAPLTGRRMRDAESIAPDGAGGFYVAFEQRHRLWRYGPGGGPARSVSPPPQLALAHRNGGIESLARLHDGRLLALSEDLGTQGGVIGWVGQPRDATGDTFDWQPLTYATAHGYAPTAAAVLPDGDLVVVERRYTLLAGPSAHIRRIAATDIRPGARLEGRLLADLAAPASVDNMEALAIRPGPGGEALLYLASDDNYALLQRTLVMVFALSAP